MSIDGKDILESDIPDFPVFESTTQLLTVPRHTYSSNAGTLCFTDKWGDAHFTIYTDEHVRALEEKGYSSADWFVPSTVTERTDFQEWKARTKTNDKFTRALNRARTLPKPDMPSFGTFGTSNEMLPGEFSINEKDHTISWYYYPAWESNDAAGRVLSPDTPENRQKLVDAGYVEASWPAIRLDEVADSVKVKMQNWLKSLPV